MRTGETFDFVVRGYECGPDETATLANVLNYLQEAAGRQAQGAGFARQDFEAGGQNVTWVLTRLKVEVLRYPRWEERVEVTTWPSGGERVIVERDFVMRSGEEVLARATSEWVLIDLTSRKIAPVPPALLASFQSDRPRALPGNEFSRLRWDCREIAPDALRIRARRGELDVNGHINNARYVEWLAEALPDGAEKPRSIELVFKSETLAGEEVAAEAVETAPGVWRLRIATPAGLSHVIAEVRLASSANGSAATA